MENKTCLSLPGYSLRAPPGSWTILIFLHVAFTGNQGLGTMDKRQAVKGKNAGTQSRDVPVGQGLF